MISTFHTFVDSCVLQIGPVNCTDRRGRKGCHEVIGSIDELDLSSFEVSLAILQLRYRKVFVQAAFYIMRCLNVERPASDQLCYTLQEGMV